MKKAITSQMFIWFLVLIFTAFIAIFGFKFIKNVLDVQEKYASVDLYTDVRDELFGIAFGETKTIDIKISNNFREVCFYDPVPISGNQNLGLDEHTRTLIVDLCDNGDNVIIFFRDSLPEVYRVENIKLNDDILCFKDQIFAKIEGIGSGKVIIMEQ